MKEFGSNGIVVDSMIRLLHHCRGRQRATAAAVIMIRPWRRQIIGSKTCVHVYRKAPNRKGDVKEKKVGSLFQLDGERRLGTVSTVVFGRSCVISKNEVVFGVFSHRPLLVRVMGGFGKKTHV
jgi:hypothetical protein